MKIIEMPQNIHSPQYLQIGDSVSPIYPFQTELLITEEVMINSVVMKKNEVEHWQRKQQFLLSHEKERLTPDFIDLRAEDVEWELANLHQLTLEVTDACNLKCKYCGYGEFYGDYDKRTDRYMDYSSIEKLLDYLVDRWNSPLNSSFGRPIFISFYGGEPLMNMPFIKRVVKYMERKTLLNNHIVYSMTTNAVLLKTHIDYLVSNQFHLLISIDGDVENNSYRVYPGGNPSFERVKRNIDFVMEHYPDYFDQNINFNSVLHNKNSVSDIYHYLKDTYGKIPSIGELNNSGIKEEKQEEFFSTYRNTTESLYQAEDYGHIKEDMFTQLGEVMDTALFMLKHSGNIFQSYNDFFASDTVVMRTPTGTCRPFAKKMFITVSGKVLTCERIGHQFGVGKIGSNGIEIDCQAIANKYNDYYKRMATLCKHCYNQDTCIQCIYNLKNIDNNPVCKGFINKIKFLKELNATMHYLSQNPGIYERLINELVIKF